MKREYASVVIESLDPKIGVTALDSGINFFKKYYSSNGIVKMIEYFANSQLYQVIYFDCFPPYEQLLIEHFQNYPNISVGFQTPPKKLSDALSEVEITLYSETSQFLTRYQLHRDKSDRIVKKIDLTSDGKPEFHTLYTFNEAGKIVLEMLTLPDGKVLSTRDW